MTLLAFLVIVVACAAMYRTHVVTQRRLEEAVKARQAALDKQAKVFVRKLEASRRAGEKAIDQSRVLSDDAKQLHQIVNEFMSNRSIKRILDREG